MAFQISALFIPTVLTVGATIIYTVPAATVLYRGRVRLTNTDTVTRTVTVYYVPSGGAVNAGTTIMNAEGIAPNTHVDVDLPAMAAASTLQALSSSATCITISQIDGVLSS